MTYKKMAKQKYELTREFLLKEYLDNDKSAQEISKELGISDDTIAKRIKQYNIPKHKKYNIGKKNGAWKGDSVSYISLHQWVRDNKLKSQFCENCKKVEPYDVANISGEYKRDINDYKWLCRKCHMDEDERLKKLHLLNRRKVKGNLYQCRNCKIFKSKDSFSKDKYTFDKLNHLCKNCLKIKYKEVKNGTKNM